MLNALSSSVSARQDYGSASRLRRCLTPERPESRADLGFIDGLRGLAALVVMVGHARWLLWEGYSGGFVSHPQDYEVVDRLGVYAFSVFRYGGAAVILFFVISGFVIHLRYAKRGRARAMSGGEAASYARRRSRRLYPPLLLAIVLTFALDMWGRAAGYAIYRQATHYPDLNEAFVSELGGWTLVGNLVFVMGAYVASWGMNEALWSLKYEAWFYACYPVLQALGGWASWLPHAVLVISAGVAITVGFPVILLSQVFSAFLLWWLGAVLADVYVGNVRLPLVALAPLALLLPVLAVVDLELRFDTSTGLLTAHAWALGFVGLLAALLEISRRGRRIPVLPRLTALGDMSYTLYVVHLPVLVLLSGWLMARDPLGRLPATTAWVPVGAAVCLCVAWAAHFLVERPFTSRRRIVVAQRSEETRES